jgi:hypothetical protein
MQRGMAEYERVDHEPVLVDQLVGNSAFTSELLP